MKVRDLLKLIEEDGWHQVAQKGSHRQFKHAEKSGRVTVAGHPSEEMDKGTLNNILKQAGHTRGTPINTGLLEPGPEADLYAAFEAVRLITRMTKILRDRRTYSRH